MSKAYIYWLHLPEHTDMKSEGYIGVSDNHQKRFKRHKREAQKGYHSNPHLQSAFQKHGDKIVKHVIWIGEETYCYKNEEILRPERDIGWNIDKGGNKPPSSKGRPNPRKGVVGVFKHTKETKDYIREHTLQQWERQHQTTIYKKDISRTPSEKHKLVGNQRTEKQKEASKDHSIKMIGRIPWNKKNG